MVTFRQLNLARPFDGVPPMDIVFLRNVLIYFDVATKAEVLRRVAQVLRPGGYLFLGGSETTYGIDDSFERVHAGKTVCYRLGQGKRGTMKTFDAEIEDIVKTIWSTLVDVPIEPEAATAPSDDVDRHGHRQHRRRLARRRPRAVPARAWRRS